MAEKAVKDYKELIGIPKVCQYKNLSSAQTEQILNENPEWLKDQGPIPLWSPLKPLNCAGQPRETAKCEETNFNVEIPGRLLSLFGSASQQTDDIANLENMDNLHLINNILALCAALKNDLNKLSAKMMDKILSLAAAQYRDVLKRHSITDKQVNTNHLNGLYHYDGDDFRAQVHQVATGVLYAPYGNNQFNLARALNWFFNRYQLGFIKCGERVLVIGKILNNQLDFFMYDCQSCGYPLFEDRQRNSYILRTPYLQILHYCLLKTINFAAKINFILYNADITILDALENRISKARVNQPMKNASAKDLVRKNVAPKERKSEQKKTPKNVQKPAQNSKPKSLRNIATASKQVASISSKNSTSQTFSSQVNNRKIILDPNKMYYIVAVPKTDLITANIQSKLLMLAKDGMSLNKMNENNQVKGEESQELEVETFVKSINLEKSASTATLTPQSTEANVIERSESLDLKVYLVENDDSQDQTQPHMENKIEIAHQLKDFFAK